MQLSKLPMALTGNLSVLAWCCLLALAEIVAVRGQPLEASTYSTLKTTGNSSSAEHSERLVVSRYTARLTPGNTTVDGVASVAVRGEPPQTSPYSAPPTTRNASSDLAAGVAVHGELLGGSPYGAPPTAGNASSGAAAAPLRLRGTLPQAQGNASTDSASSSSVFGDVWLRNVNSGLALSSEFPSWDSRSLGRAFIMQDAYVGDAAQRWVIVHLGGQMVWLQNAYSGLALSCQYPSWDSRSRDRALVVQDGYVGDAAQHWVIHNFGSQVLLRNVHSNLALSSEYPSWYPESHSRGARINQDFFVNDAAQLWFITQF